MFSDGWGRSSAELGMFSEGWGGPSAELGVFSDGWGGSSELELSFWKISLSFGTNFVE